MKLGALLYRNTLCAFLLICLVFKREAHERIFCRCSGILRNRRGRTNT